MGIKENWEKVDEVCSSCGHVTKQQKGITRQNIRKLFSFKMDYTEFLITFMLVVIIIMAFAYTHETKESREWVASMYSGSKENCLLNCNYKCNMLNISIDNSVVSPINLTNLTLITWR